MPRFRKKPVEIDARQFDGTVESANRILGWIGSNGGDAKRAHATRPELGLVIHTIEGAMRAEPGDWIIRGVVGEFYPCRADIFEATYEPVETATIEGILEPVRYAPSHDERVRLAALDLAITARDSGEMWSNIVVRAEAFRKFLAGGSK